MINNDVASHLNRYFSNRAGQSGGGNVASEIYKRLKQRQDAVQGRNTGGDEEQAKAEKAAEETAGQRVGNGMLRKTKQKNSNGDKAAAATKEKEVEKEELSPQERRKKELQAILDKINAEEAQRHPSRVKSKETEKAAESTVVTTENADEAAKSEGFMGFLNDMPLFNEFKSGLIDAFKMLDSASAGSISAQYELNYTSMQYVANAAGGFDYKETTFNVKLDLNYIKAAAGGQDGKSIADIIAGSNDFESLVNNLKNANQQQAQKTQTNPKDFMAGLQDYFSPEKTADRIVDFATAFFPTSDQFKAKGDTPEAREEFAEIMRKAIQKGFDQAMGTLGAVPKKTQEGIDKTHELVFKGIDDFVKNGLNKEKQDQGIYEALEAFTFSAEISYTEKTYSVRTGTTSYNQNGEAQNQSKTQSALDTQA